MRWRELRDPRVLKILSTTAVFAAPIARRAICVAHGFPRPDVQGWRKALGVTASFKVANWFARLVAVSYYTAIHLRTIFNLRVDAVIHNPLDDAFLAESGSGWKGATASPLRGGCTPRKAWTGFFLPCTQCSRITRSCVPRLWEMASFAPGRGRGAWRFAHRACWAGLAERRADMASPNRSLRLRMRNRSARNCLS